MMDWEINFGDDEKPKESESLENEILSAKQSHRSFEK